MGGAERGSALCSFPVGGRRGCKGGAGTDVREDQRGMRGRPTWLFFSPPSIPHSHCPPPPCLARGLCTWRTFHDGNNTGLLTWTYSLEVLMHEMMLQSEHRCERGQGATCRSTPMSVTCNFPRDV